MESLSVNSICHILVLCQGHDGMSVRKYLLVIRVKNESEEHVAGQ